MANYSLYKSIIKIKINISLYNKLYDMYSLLQQTSTTDIYIKFKNEKRNRNRIKPKKDKPRKHNMKAIVNKLLDE